ncbi:MULTISPECIES: translation initiation factor IF-2 [unclassified Sphingomonas]|uniref:translation initiation factor IF-2 n=1 Tax=unclassified Sphingomonas TaxID=196159 RepID=UPI0006F8C0C2|nr:MULTISPECIES: translation initiation factor IF-2 [unclassified Sphingomonas]KQX17715.1 translation initiation factor IF-2 [Sphingomonas sp. Root1294]KQY70641.1 translation initiation factor IF-2 [Sphingomonas sp. Root50]KRB91867.1 translation initiation factor IF-2 [Sphingomonas sp. Root720]
MSDNDKPKLGMRAPLGLKRTVETGQVKQSFSHGRSNTVVVEVKRRRVLGRPGEAEPQVTEEVVAPPAAPAPAPAPAPAAQAPAAPRPAPAPVPSGRPMTPLERREQQARLLREADEARMTALEEARRREERAKAEATEEERRRAEENRRAEEEAGRNPAEAPSAPAAPAEVETAAAAAPRAEAPAAEETAPRTASTVPPPRRFTPVPSPKRPEPPRPQQRDRKGDDRRQSGKLTVTKALDDDSGARARSLAALKRAREKDKRAHQAGTVQQKQVRDVAVPETITVGELANRMAERGADLVKALFKMGMPVTVNQSIDQDTAELLVTEFGHNIKRVSDADVDLVTSDDVDATETLQTRPPVVTIMGHVDHGKTSLLDALRGTDVVSGEAGGITQHIGAYQVTVQSGSKITFLDTPGHEAFSDMRARGANITDIVVIVVAGDDGLRPQTIEAISHTRAAGVPMIIAINKMDKPGSNAQKVREALLQHDVQVESMGGDVQEVEVSALKKTGLDELIEKIELQAELLELKANPDRPAEGTVVEATLDKGRGAVATILVGRGTLKVGDIFVVGAESGKVRALIDDKGRNVKEAGPSLPVEILGLSGVPSAGDQLSVVENEARAREVAAYRAGVIQAKRTTSAPASLESMFSALREQKAQQYPVVVKADAQGSVEAIVGSLNKISTDLIQVRILHAGVGGITESDVSLAAASKAPIIGFNVRANAKAREIATRDGVALKYYDVIYDLLDEIRAAMAGQLGPEYLEHVVGRAEIREVFSAGKHGKAAGLLVLEGYIRQKLRARILRDDVIIYNGSIASLRRFKDDVPEVRAGLECGITLESTTDIKPGDIVETFEVEERERTL